MVQLAFRNHKSTKEIKTKTNFRNFVFKSSAMKKRDYIKIAQDNANLRIWDFISIRYQSIARRNAFLGICGL